MRPRPTTSAATYHVDLIARDFGFWLAMNKGQRPPTPAPTSSGYGSLPGTTAREIKLQAAWTLQHQMPFNLLKSGPPCLPAPPGRGRMTYSGEDKEFLVLDAGHGLLTAEEPGKPLATGEDLAGRSR